MNTTPAAAGRRLGCVDQAGFVVTPEYMQALAAQMGEQTLIAAHRRRAVSGRGIAHIFSGLTSALGGKTPLGAVVSLRDHVRSAVVPRRQIDTGTRVGGFMLQEIVGHVGHSSARPRGTERPAVERPGVRRVGYFLYQEWWTRWRHQRVVALFGISNQLLAAVALCVRRRS